VSFHPDELRQGVAEIFAELDANADYQALLGYEWLRQWRALKSRKRAEKRRFEQRWQRKQRPKVPAVPVPLRMRRDVRHVPDLARTREPQPRQARGRQGASRARAERAA
jgi:hypothetical protein